MKRLVLLLPLLSLTAFATPSGRKWSLVTCTSTCTANGTNNMACVQGRCLPKVRFAASVGNSGVMTLNGPSAVPYATALTSMRAAFEVWTTPNVTTCATSLEFSFQPTFATPAGTAAISGGDRSNSVIWLGGTQWRYGSGTLGLTTTTFYSGQLTDADIEMNNNSRWGTTGLSTDQDVQSVVAHEAGHAIGLAHTTASNAVMNPSIAAGTLKRALFSADLSDVCGVYPGTTGGQGTACTTGTMCTPPLVCEGETGSSTLACTQDCTAVGQTCPAGNSCQASTAGFACLPEVGAADQCRFCLSGSDCSTGVCLMSGMGQNYCSQACTVGTPGQCGVGSVCADNGMGTFCLPTGACTNQCTVGTAATDCAPGYVCQAGTCTPTGAVGDRCEASNFCQSCASCVPDSANPSVSYCRACCNGLGECTGCTTTTCGPIGSTPTLCGAVPSASERVCLPTAGAGQCQACDAANPCNGANVCFGGRCHSGCDPANPGTCAACLPQTGGGICGCSDEIAEQDEPCSSTGTLAICRAGLLCSSGACRKPCVLDACDPGYVCAPVPGINVCVPGVVDAGPTGGGGGGATGGGGGGVAAGGGGGTTATGGGMAQVICGASTCAGCCDFTGQCVQPSDQACGTFGGSCRACSETETCEVGACVEAPKKGCGCTSFEGASAVLLALLGLVRRRVRGTSARAGGRRGS